MTPANKDRFKTYYRIRVQIKIKKINIYHSKKSTWKFYQFHIVINYIAKKVKRTFQLILWMYDVIIPVRMRQWPARPLFGAAGKGINKEVW